MKQIIEIKILEMGKQKYKQENIKIKKSNMLEAPSAFSLPIIFNDPEYAWRLLQAQISLQMTPTVSGQLIARLLQLYMKGVEKMNSISDQRQSYFKNKVTSLMTKGVVIKSLKQNPMKKKAQHQEASCKQQPKPLIKKLPEPLQASKQISTISHIELKQKQKQFEMRVQYSRQQNNPDNLKKLMLQEECRQENISKKISTIINNHEERLKERIKARKLRTATYRTQSVFNQESETQPSTHKFNSNRKEDLYFFQPHDSLVKNLNQSKSAFLSKINSVMRKWKSLQKNKNPLDEIVRKRKYTIDL